MGTDPYKDNSCITRSGFHQYERALIINRSYVPPRFCFCRWRNDEAMTDLHERWRFAIGKKFCARTREHTRAQAAWDQMFSSPEDQPHTIAFLGGHSGLSPSLLALFRRRKRSGQNKQSVFRSVNAHMSSSANDVQPLVAGCPPKELRQTPYVQSLEMTETV